MAATFLDVFENVYLEILTSKTPPPADFETQHGVIPRV